MTNDELADYVISLKLTPRQQAFAEAYVLAPENGTKAAQVGHPEVTRAAAAVTASRWLKTPKVLHYIDLLRGTSEVRLDEAGKRTEVVGRVSKVTTALERNLERLEAMAEGREPWETSRVRHKDKEGNVSGSMERDVFARGAAASKIVDHYAPREEASGGNRTMIFNLLGKVPPEVLLPQVYSMISGGRTRPPRDDD